MTPTEIRATREALGLTPQGLASALRCTARAVRMWEQGTRNAPGPAVVAMELLLTRHRLDERRRKRRETKEPSAAGSGHAPNVPLDGDGERTAPESGADSVPMDGDTNPAASVSSDAAGERAMTRFVIERRNAIGEVIERTAPFIRGDMEGKRAEIHQHQIAELHNRSRASDDRQLVYRVEEKQ